MSENLLGMFSAREQLLLEVSQELQPVTRMKVTLEFIPGNSYVEVYSWIYRIWSR